MKKWLLFFVVGILIAYPLTGIAGYLTIPGEYLDIKNPFNGADKAVIERGEILYMRKCKNCHGEKGEGMTEGLKIKPFTKEHLITKSDGLLLFVCEKGLQDAPMPAFGQGTDANLSRDELWKVITFIRERFGK